MELTALLFQLGITPNYKAYNQIISAISLALQDTGVLLFMTKRLYPAVAQKHATNWRAVERNIRHASERAWQCNPVLLSRLAGYSLTGSPTSSQFVCQHLQRISAWICPPVGVALQGGQGDVQFPGGFPQREVSHPTVPADSGRYVFLGWNGK